MEAAAVAYSGSHASSAFQGHRRIILNNIVPKSMGSSTSAAFFRPVSVVGPLRCNLRVATMPVCHCKKNDSFEHEIASHKYSHMGLYLLVIGLGYQRGHPKALVNLALSHSRIAHVVGELSSLPHVGEAAIISTCNCFEIYAVGLDASHALQELSAWMAKKSKIPADEFHDCCYWHIGHGAARHLFEATAGIRSLVPDGKHLAHVRKTTSCLEGFEGFGRIMKTLFEHAISVGELVRSELNLTVHSLISFGSAAVELALMNSSTTGGWGSSSQLPQVLVIGAGKMAAIVINHLVVKGYKTIRVIDISEGRVSGSMRDKVKGAELIYMPREQIASCIGDADIVFTCTTCGDPFIFKEDVIGELKNPLLRRSNLGSLKIFVDTSIPHNVDDSVSRLPFARVFKINDIEQVLQNEMKGGRKDEKVDAYIDKQIVRFERWLNSVGAVHILQLLRRVFKRDYILGLEKSREIDLDMDYDFWRPWIDDTAETWADLYVYNFTHHLKTDLGNEFSKLVDDEGYPRFDNEEMSAEDWFC